MVEKIDIVDLYYNFINYCWDKITTKNKDAITTLSSMVNGVTNKFQSNSCDFLNDDAVKIKITQIVNESKAQMQIPIDTEITEQNYQDQIDYIKNNVFKLKISDYVNQDNEKIKTRVVKDISYVTSKPISDLTFKDLDNYFNMINLNYFNTFLTEWINNYLQNDYKIRDENLQQIKNYIREIGYKDGVVGSLSIFFKQQFITLQRKRCLPYEAERATADFEQSDIIYYPSIKIFCTSDKYDDDLFNRFTYFHEMGHSLINNGFFLFTNKDVCIGILKDPICTGLPWDFNINRTINERYPGFLDKILCSHLVNINEIIIPSSNKTPAASYDIICDIFSFSVIIKDMRDKKKSIADIFSTVYTICASLGSDENHYSSNLRFILNVYLNDELRNYFEQGILSKLPHDPYIYVATKNYIDRIIDLFKKLKGLLTDTTNIESINELIEVFNDNKDNYINYITMNSDDSTIKMKKYTELYETYDDTKLVLNKDKIILFFNDFSQFTIESDESLYQKKYIKYKNKYLAIKKKLAL